MPWPRDTQVKHMKKKVELPVSEPVYSTYQYQGSMAGLLRCNPSLRNWYLNHAHDAALQQKIPDRLYHAGGGCGEFLVEERAGGHGKTV